MGHACTIRSMEGQETDLWSGMNAVFRSASLNDKTIGKC